MVGKKAESDDENATRKITKEENRKCENGTKWRRMAASRRHCAIHLYISASCRVNDDDKKEACEY